MGQSSPKQGRPLQNYAKRTEDVNKAVRILRKNRVPIGVPMLKADGEMLFPVNDLTITATQILELFDNHDLNITAVRKNRAEFWLSFGLGA